MAGAVIATCHSKMMAGHARLSRVSRQSWYHVYSLTPSWCNKIRESADTPCQVPVMYTAAHCDGRASHLQPSMGIATRWQTNTVMPMANGASTCRERILSGLA